MATRARAGLTRHKRQHKYTMKFKNETVERLKMEDVCLLYMYTQFLHALSSNTETKSTHDIIHVMQVYQKSH